MLMWRKAMVASPYPHLTLRGWATISERRGAGTLNRDGTENRNYLLN
jgi:hypothetical protein